LFEHKKLELLGLNQTSAETFIKEAGALQGEALSEARNKVRDAVVAGWAEVEKGFAPTRRKYA